jgi:DDE superfamily endonuclease
LPAYSIDGYLATSIFQGGGNTEGFEDFIIDSVLLQCTPYPGPRSVLIMDNCSIHKSPIIEEACAKAGVLLEFLPPYSPDFNPIESSFGDLKAWIQRNNREIEKYNTYGQLLSVAVSINGLAKNAIGHFRHCHINIDNVI